MLVLYPIAATMSTHLIYCFSTDTGGGNPALVIEHNQDNQAQRQLIAQASGVSACVFIDRQADGAIVLDYFYPHTRSPLCLHATLAASHVLLASEGAPGSLHVTTAMHGQPLQLSRGDDRFFVGVVPQPVPALTLESYLPSELLAGQIELASPPVIASVGSPKLLLEVPNRTVLRALRPNLELIADWGRLHAINGCYAYCQLEDGQYEGRNFNHLDPAREDCATGVAAGALAWHLQQSLSVQQGHVTQQPCLIEVQLQNGLVWVGGMVQTSTAIVPD